MNSIKQQIYEHIQRQVSFRALGQINRRVSKHIEDHVWELELKIRRQLANKVCSDKIILR